MLGVIKLHRTQVSILHDLRYAESVRFNTMMRPTGQTSDTFKFHLRKLVQLGYVEKTLAGAYRLTIIGKEYANNLDEVRRAPKRQPKLSVFIIAQRAGLQGTEFLLFKRARSPFMGFWTAITETARWGESFELTAARAFEKQTDLKAEFTVHAFRRVTDYVIDSTELLEDKLFVIMRATTFEGELRDDYAGGHHAWLTIDQLKSQPLTFTSTVAILEQLQRPLLYIEQDQFHEQTEY